MTALEKVVSTFRRWLHLPDLGPLLIYLGSLAANRMQGDPVWLMFVGPPSSGKNEILLSGSAVPGVIQAGALTEAGLLSGSPASERQENATGGLLREIGDQGIVIMKDFNTVLAMHRDARARVIAALREIYDGQWTRHLGTDGGIRLSWSGKVGLIAGCTPHLDRHHAVISAMGERFVFCRMLPADAGCGRRETPPRAEAVALAQHRPARVAPCRRSAAGVARSLQRSATPGRLARRVVAGGLAGGLARDLQSPPSTWRIEPWH